ncbi:MAG: iron-regulated protein [Draconibacterium sp.]|nr:MAG: iron-regulated protein [Draconibacterium sp.]
MRKYIVMVALLAIFSAFKADKPAYTLFDKDGKRVKYEKMIKVLEGADIVLFGELHNNPVAHWLELEVTKDLFNARGNNLVLGAEMFESDNQVILNEYLDSLIRQTNFESEARLWPNYKTDYKPLVEFAKIHRIPFIATNVPRRYASLVNKKGFEGLEELSDEAKAFLPPLPVQYNPELNCYKSMMEMQGMGSHITPNFPKAQAIKDATMAYFIIENRGQGKLLLHFHGSYHSQDYESIYWYLKQVDPDLNITTIHTVSQADVSELEPENTSRADFTICVDEDMTKTR